MAEMRYLVASRCPVLSERGSPKPMNRKTIGDGGPTGVNLGTGFWAY
jgi:hypothetical protein